MGGGKFAPPLTPSKRGHGIKKRGPLLYPHPGAPPADDSIRQALWDNEQVALIYAQPDGSPTSGEFPHNPNGSIDDIAGVCDSTGLVFGLMPHPERHISPLQHPAWTSRGPNGEGQ